MIIGRGDLASAIKDREGFTFFCTGVSNREPITDRQKQTELNRIWRSSRDGMFVYISTLSVYRKDAGNRAEYIEHKKDMENLVRRTFDNYCIVRIGNITWGTNPNTIVNSFRSRINEEIQTDNTYRYLVDKEEFNHWVDQIPVSGKHEMNITGRMVTPEQIIYEIKEGKL